jgi:hypothetical protein
MLSSETSVGNAVSINLEREQVLARGHGDHLPSSIEERHGTGVDPPTQIAPP